MKNFSGSRNFYAIIQLFCTICLTPGQTLGSCKTLVESHCAIVFKQSCNSNCTNRYKFCTSAKDKYVCRNRSNSTWTGGQSLQTVFSPVIELSKLENMHF